MAFSGLYTGTDAGAQRLLHLRVDVDQAVPHALVLNRVSGDVFELLDDRQEQGTHQFSWHIEVPRTIAATLPFRIDGPVTVLGGRAIAGVRVEIEIQRSGSRVEALVTMTRADEFSARLFTCVRRGPWFREVRLDFDVCRKSARRDAAPRAFREPRFTPGASGTRAPAAFARTVSLDQAWLEAGVKLDRQRAPQPIDDRSKRNGWDDSELDDALREQLKVRGLDVESAWPRWFLWCFLAGKHSGDDVRGVMFDSDRPARQGCAVFVDQDDFKPLPAGEPANEREAFALRFYLFTWMHEIGHGFNLRHSSDERRPTARSWMNFELAMLPRGEFWNDFVFSFDPDELLHVRHADFPAVVMGGDRLDGDGRLASPRPGRLSSVVPIARGRPRRQLDALLRSREYFDFMAPVRMEIRLRNRADEPTKVFEALHPEVAHIVVVIGRPDGRVVEYVPLLHKVQRPTMRKLAPRGQGKGADRYSCEMDLTYGRDGFCFDAPGEYRVRVFYLDPAGGVVASNVASVRIGYPSPLYERLAQDYFSDDVGRCLYLRGSHAKYLERNGLNVLREMTARCVGTAMGCDLADALEPGVARPFWQLKNATVDKSKEANPRGALELTEQALRFLERADARAFNLGDRRLVTERARHLARLQQQQAAVDEMVALYKRLKKRGVKAWVLDDLRRSAKSIVGRSIDAHL